MDTQDLLAHLPQAIATRLSSARMVGTRAVVVLDATGLGASERAAIERDIMQALGGLEGVEDVRVAMMADRVRRRIIAIGSGKGGVGKSTLTTNLAVALQRMGVKVGVVDADIYGPSQPKLLGLEGRKPEAQDEKLVPVTGEHGVPVLSMGFLVKPAQALAWRGPMAGNALSQLVDAQWGDVELLLIDLPPGTGDVQLSMLQKHKPDGAVLVSTPQDLALIDAARAGQLFDQGKVPLIGLVENMAGYQCPHCGEMSDPFGQGGVEAMAGKVEIPFLGRIPLALPIREAGDSGQPPAASDTPEGQAFAAIAKKLVDWLERENA
ncbi:Mrp/NBP35 family ATP-binding protein [Altererythrobacter sp. BO-6]|uniref:Mrp/NBP35 family ATP-binding protein n=1 Tax=Altererythrobacter sp. BO-6 TaxID=2604537 RepID=UPI0013E145C8|nr:Mrp/NBP35 family ATP-binding protein [Altererythrobacter sp. BO-6]QIG53964.1 Mrp/NBP35 family ATP-binding protein [Altererythrobacter sp. BO-6]